MTQQFRPPHTWSRRQTAAIVTLLLAEFAPGCGPNQVSTPPESSDASPVATVEVGKLAPDFTLTGPDGEQLSLSDYRGSVVLLDFWASWCGPCKEELPALESLYATHRGAGLVVLGVNVDEDRDDALALLQASAISFPVGLDPEGRVAETYAPPTMPTSYLIDGEGIVVEIHAGYEAGDAEALDAAVASLVAKR